MKDDYLRDVAAAWVQVSGGSCVTHGVATARTAVFTLLLFAECLRTLSVRQHRHFAWTGIFRNLWLLGAIALSVSLSLIVLFLPPLQTIFSTTYMVGADDVVWKRHHF